MLKAGAMDRRIVVEKPTITQDALGGRVEAWQEVCQTWAEIVPQSVRARYDGAVESSERKVIFRVRYISDIKETQRVRYEDKTYQIIGLQELGRREGLEILAVSAA